MKRATFPQCLQPETRNWAETHLFPQGSFLPRKTVPFREGIYWEQLPNLSETEPGTAEAGSLKLRLEPAASSWATLSPAFALQKGQALTLEPAITELAE